DLAGGAAVLGDRAALAEGRRGGAAHEGAEVEERIVECGVRSGRPGEQKEVEARLPASCGATAAVEPRDDAVRVGVNEDRGPPEAEAQDRLGDVVADARQRLQVHVVGGDLPPESLDDVASAGEEVVRAPPQAERL